MAGVGMAAFAVALVAAVLEAHGNRRMAGFAAAVSIGIILLAVTCLAGQ
jgi:hypothetical protein